MKTHKLVIYIHLCSSFNVSIADSSRSFTDFFFFSQSFFFPLHLHAVFETSILELVTRCLHFETQALVGSHMVMVVISDAVTGSQNIVVHECRFLLMAKHMW